MDYYFGPMVDPTGRVHWLELAKRALDEWRRRWEGITAGRDPGAAAADPELLTLADVCRRFIRARHDAVESGDITQLTYRNVLRRIRCITEVIDAQTQVHDLSPEHFRSARLAWSKRFGVEEHRHLHGLTRRLFDWAHEDLGTAVPRFGADFKPPAKKHVRRARLRREGDVYTPQEILRMLGAAGPSMRAMILLGINGGYGNHDLATIPRRLVHLDRGMIDCPRTKTDAVRRVPLWPETIDAIADALEHEDPASSLLFSTRTGRALVRHSGGSWIDGIAQRYKRLTRALTDEHGRPMRGSFYWLRHTFSTIAQDIHSDIFDDHARMLIMGHVIESVHHSYARGFPSERLQRVTDGVRAWLFASAAGTQPDLTGRASVTVAPPRDEEGRLTYSGVIAEGECRSWRR